MVAVLPSVGADHFSKEGSLVPHRTFWLDARSLRLSFNVLIPNRDVVIATCSSRAVVDNNSIN
jgi:hypothetical protein